MAGSWTLQLSRARSLRPIPQFGVNVADGVACIALQLPSTCTTQLSASLERAGAPIFATYPAFDTVAGHSGSSC